MTDPVPGATVSYRIRFDECGSDGTARAASYLRWAQDIAWIHSEQLGYARGWYAARRMAWLVRGIALEIDRPSASGDVISLSTQITGFRRVWARRETDVRDEAGLAVGRIVTDWVMTDERGLPARVPAEFIERYAHALGTFEPVRVGVAEAASSASRVSFTVRPHEIDPLGHANNAVYLDWADESLAAAGASVVGPRRYRAEYVYPSLPQERLSSTAWRLDGGFACRIDSVEAGSGEGGRSDRLRLRLEA